MKTTVSVHLGGHLMHAEEDAHRSLVLYLDSIKNHLRNTEGREEILSDIESRFAELLLERWSGKSGVVTIVDVQSVIHILGSPMQWSEDSNDAFSETESVNNKQSETGYRSNHDGESPAPKRLFRDGSRRVIGGVSAGLAAYFGLDLALVRVVVLLLGVFTGIGIFAYLVLWVAVPKARTTADRLAMQGRAVTLDSIRSKVEEEYRAVEQTLQNPTNHRRWEASLRGWVREANGIAAPVLRGLGKLVGLVLALGTVVFLIGIGLVFWFYSMGMGVGDGLLVEGDFSLRDWVALFWPSTLSWGVGWFALGLVLVGPLVLMGVLAVRFLRGAPFRFMRTLLGLSVLAFILGALLAMMPLAFYAEDIEYKAVTTQTIPLDSTLHEWSLELMPTFLDAQGRPLDFEGEAWVTDGEFRIGSDQSNPESEALDLVEWDKETIRWRKAQQRIYVNNLGIRLVPTEGRALLKSNLRAAGRSKAQAKTRSALAGTSYICDSTGRIALAEGVHFPKSDGFRMQKAQWTLYVPVGHSIRMDERLASYLEETLVVGDFPVSELAGQRCIMTSNGLVRMGL
jgi:phage shock protein PspC (stress-responsive transcriptional regulator)